MNWDQITNTWTRFWSRLPSPPTWKSKAGAANDSVESVSSTGQVYSKEKATPFIPDGRLVRGESSLHLSC